MPNVIFDGEPMNGTEDRDLIIDVPGAPGPNSTINGNGGNDLILGDGDHFWLNTLGHSNTSLGAAMDIDSAAWSPSTTNPIINTPGPHTSVYIEPGAGQHRYFSVTVGANETLTLDVDFAGNTGWGRGDGSVDTIVDVLDAEGNVVASNDDFPGDFGSLSTLDSRASYTPTEAGTYYIRVREYDASGIDTFEGGELIFLNVSVTNHAAASSPIAAGNDTISGGEGNDTIFGMLGTDTVHGNNGNDVIASTSNGAYYGDAGNDTIYGGGNTAFGGSEVLDGGADVDTLDTTSFNLAYTIDLATGLTNYSADYGESFVNFENLRSGGGNDTLGGTAAANTIQGGNGNDVINGLAGNDNLQGEGGDDTLNGGDNDDLLTDYSGVNVLNGGNGADQVYCYLTNLAEAHGGAGADILYLYAPVAGAVTVNLNGVSTLGGSTMVTDGFESLYFGSNSDVTVTVVAEQDNTITTSGGNDTIDAGRGTDTIFTGAGNDTIRNINFGSVNGGDGVDTIDFSANIGSGTYYVDLALGVSLTGLTGPFYATLSNLENFIGRESAHDQVRGTNAINAMSGNGGDDVLYGRHGDDTLEGDGGADRLYGDQDNDLLDGGDGNDVLNGGAGDDGMIGGLGDDIYYVNGGGDSVVEAGSAGHDTVRSTADYTLTANVEELSLKAGARIGTGNTIDNTIFGSAGQDTLSGLGGADILRGNDARDTLLGGAGQDLLDGGAGKDTLTGGADRDVFQFRDGDFAATRPLADLITDFSQAANEKVNLNLVDANGIAGGNQAFAWIGTGAFTGVAGQLRYAQQGGNTYAEGDINGDGTADLVIAFTGLITLAAADFVL